MRFINND
jgi:2-keto-4-pentenoate hydratase/2-oxohepta-3-ene-1,7-dioic acid hydratase in catechol pathway